MNKDTFHSNVTNSNSQNDVPVTDASVPTDMNSMRKGLPFFHKYRVNKLENEKTLDLVSKIIEEQLSGALAVQKQAVAAQVDILRSKIYVSTAAELEKLGPEIEERANGFLLATSGKLVACEEETLKLRLQVRERLQKWVSDGLITVEEAANKLRKYEDHFEALDTYSHHLDTEIKRGHVNLVELTINRIKDVIK